MKKYNLIDLFAGCGGMEEGFLQTGYYNEIAAVEWLIPQVETLKHRLETKWKIKDVDERVMHFDIQRDKELFCGWNDPKFGSNKGLDYYVNKAKEVDVIIGGPPCQAYSVAGRVRDEKGMKEDYRNYLFEHYLNVVERYKPKVFVFENVPGITSACPNGTPIIDLIKKGFNKIGYDISEQLNIVSKINASEYGVPQNRKRMIIVGINKREYKNTQDWLNKFYYEFLPKYKTKYKLTVKDSIGDLPPCYPISNKEKYKHTSHVKPDCDISWHNPRFHNSRDMDTFMILADDIKNGNKKFDSKKITKLYEDKVGSKSPIHRYHVLDPELPSTTIIAHLYKDGNRFIHYDPLQCRTITVREAARLQSFDDDFHFIGTQSSAYQMIGNAVPPRLAKAIGMAIKDLISTMDKNK